MALIKLCDKTIEELCEEIDETVDIFEYLLNLSNCIAIWYNSILLPKHITKEQINSVKLLNKYKLIDIGDDIDETLLHWNDD